MRRQPARQVAIGFDEEDLVTAAAQRLGDRLDGRLAVAFRIVIGRQRVAGSTRTLEVVRQRDAVSDGTASLRSP